VLKVLRVFKVLGEQLELLALTVQMELMALMAPQVLKVFKVLQGPRVLWVTLAA
jgi:hypothetical protein